MHSLYACREIPADCFCHYLCLFAARDPQYSREQFGKWSDAIGSSLRDKDPDLVLNTSGRLMELDLNNSGELKVHYSERLITLLREVRRRCRGRGRGAV